MNDPISRLREQFPDLRRRREARNPPGRPSPDTVQILTAKLLLFTGIGTAVEAVRGHAGGNSGGGEHVTRPGRHSLGRPLTAGPVLLGTAAAIAHAVHAFHPTESTRLATRTFDLAVVGAGLLSLADSLAAARRNRSIPSVGSVALASAGLLGILIDRDDARVAAERQRLERRASVVERLVPQRRSRFDRIVVHV